VVVAGLAALHLRPASVRISSKCAVML
jgi:hypothetical protein